MTIEWAFGLVSGLLLLLLGWLKADTRQMLKYQRETNGRVMKIECWREEHTRMHRRFNGMDYTETTNLGE